jgi:RNA ligase (TIGR02306 family)
MRHLATIRKIDAINPIPDADTIEVASFGGWKVVVKKGEHQVGELVIYCEVDSFIPNNIAPFLTKEGKTPSVYEGVSGERLRTIRLRGQLSQGLVLPLKLLWTNNFVDWSKCPWDFQSDWDSDPDSVLGIDVTEYLGIVKYEPPVPAQLAGVVKGAFPSVFPKTDEERIQNLSNDWAYLKTLAYEVTEKLEGSSMSVGLIDGEFIVCSRNLNLKETEGNSLWAQARRYNIEANLRHHEFNNIIIQGEIVGEGIQGNHYNLKGQDFYVFTIYDIERGQFYTPEERLTLVQDLGLKHVPTVVWNFVFPEDTSIEQVLEAANGKSQLVDKLREGLVYKQMASGPVHWKAVSDEYLFKYGRG